MPKKRRISVLNWDKYQARSDKDLPWCKLWGTLFDRPWFQNMPDNGKIFAIVLLDLARKTGNFIGEEYLLTRYLSGNYGLLCSQNEVFIFCKSLRCNGFLSDNVSDLQDKIRQDKIREEGTVGLTLQKQEKEKTPKTIDEVKDYFKVIGGFPGDAEGFFDHFTSNGWKVGGKAPMQDWKASARGWVRRNKQKEPKAYAMAAKKTPNQNCSACNGSGKLPDGKKCWCF
jgi:hypothetical protein